MEEASASTHDAVGNPGTKMHMRSEALYISLSGNDNHACWIVEQLLAPFYSDGTGNCPFVISRLRVGSR